jgi:hypothetical protein
MDAGVIGIHLSHETEETGKRDDSSAYSQYNALPRQSEVFVVEVYEVAPLFGDVVFGEDGDYRANRLAGGAVDAFVRVNEILIVLVFGVNAVHRTDIHAGAVLQVNTRLGYDIGHLYEFLLLSRCASRRAVR